MKVHISDAILDALAKNGYLYTTEAGERIRAFTLSELPKELRAAGYRNVREPWESDLRKWGFTVTKARYAGGARRGALVNVVTV